MITGAVLDSGKLTGINAVHYNPTNGRVKIKNIHVKYVSSASVGNRQIVVEVKPDQAGAAGAGNIMFQSAAGAVQAASLTRRYAAFFGAVKGAAFVGNAIELSMPDLVVPALGRVSVYDSANIDAAGDAMEVYIQCEDAAT